MTVPAALEGLRRPEYTGENRCAPCTVVNVAIAAGVSIPVAAVSGPVGAALFAGCLLAIYLRGYLVPGTPELTKRYLPPTILRLFGKDPAPRTLGDPTDGELWTTLETAGIVEREDAPVLTSEFRSRWLAAIDDTGDGELDEGAVERTLGTDDVAKRGERAFSVGGSQLVRWDSRAAFRADVAAVAVLADRFDDWAKIDLETRRALLERLRILLDRCPDCGGAVERDDERVDPCCQRAYTVVWADCPDCGSFLAELSAPAAEDDELTPLRSPSDPPA